MRDFESYYAAGETWAEHGDPYSTDIWKFEQRIPGVQAARTELLPFIGPPAFLPLWALFAQLPFGTAAILWGFILVASAVMFAVVILRFTDTLSAGAFLSVAVLMIGFGPFTSDLALGQAAFLSFVACTGAAAMLERREMVSVIWTFFAALQPNIALVLLSQANRRRAWLVFSVAFLTFVGACIAFAGWPHAIAYVCDLNAHANAERFVLIQMSPPAIIYGFGATQTVAAVCGVLFAIAALGVCIAIVRRADVKPIWKLAASCALLPFIVPFFHEHDFIVLLLPAILCAALCEGPLWSAAATGTVLAAVDWLGLAQRPDGMAQSLLLAAASLCALFALSDVSWRRLFAPAGVLGILAGLGFLAQSHIAPIWPDAMHGAVSLSGSVAQIWHEELAHTGEFAVNPFWALLRSLSLAGTALLAWATYASAVRRDQLEIS